MTAQEEFDRELRLEAMGWLTRRTQDGLEAIRSDELLEFSFNGSPFRLMDAQRGIRKPRELESALSIRTVYSPDEARRPYADEIGDDGSITYKWRGDDPSHPENRGLRRAMELGQPLIWFFGVGTALYKPIYPIYVVREEPEQHQFILAPDDVAQILRAGEPESEQMRRYVQVESKRRLHQPVFRATVMRAYETRCAVCALKHGELLDAAHIVPDSHESGIASVTNGLALCKIHHAAFDRHILGIRPDKYVVEIRKDLLDEIDGPMLQHGLKERHGEELMVVPKSRRDRPDRQLLEISYERFRAAS
ncbi:HNH endonuclease [Gordonia aquimaris]|uniref:HNH endonuclease n=1 Tax=Gordonia aquimaris TaxID=2984863 RepID=A0A9X3D6X9_9ACTN|nr:HNH endonuclease [Gordonia aquimaris]MCX2966279.1 HNH endonuclease [Gordonia aquimaris]